ncbi:MAG: MBL fold metallo-hydrolase [Deltaproteobacteria bacterium]|jgi:metallo-beta-lactamase family protein|nr:MBL fold metallo-hydrolase [Deltaproteobacteria bacterium]
MNYPFNLTHVGAENCVTGSCHLMELPGSINIMVDCGLTMGGDTALSLSQMPVKPSELDYLFITHAHIDHIGRIPDLIDLGFDGEIITTHGTNALLIPMLEDALAFTDRSEKEIKVLSARINDLSWGFEYNQSFSLKKGIKFKLKNAGHILGSCFIRFEIPVKEKTPFSVIFSGDLGSINTPILPDPDIPDHCDLLILESTYGDRNHEDRTKRIENLSAMLRKALADKGKIYIPAFALGRTQELIYEMDRIFTREKWDTKIPVFIDSPLGLKITGIYSSLSEFWDKEARTLFKKGDHPIDFKKLFAVENQRDHKRILNIPGPAIIVAGSGMCTGGRILDHLENSLEDSKNDVIFVGYQAKETPGREIIKYARRKNGYVNLNGQKVAINAAIHKLTGYSAHADQKGLVGFVESMGEKPGKIKLVHGEPGSQKVLRNILYSKGCK